MFLYLYRYIKLQIHLKQHPDIEIPPSWPVWVKATLDRSMERERMKEEWSEVREACRVEKRLLP